MNILIINTNSYRLPMPVIPLGACMVADAASHAGHTVHFLDLMFERGPIAKLEQELTHNHYDVIGLSIRNIDNNDLHTPRFFYREIKPLMEVIRKKSSAVVVLGGAAVAVMPEETLQHFGASYAVAGDGESSFPALLDALQEGEPNATRIISSSHSSLPGPCPLPDFRKWIDVKNYLAHFSTIPLQTKLGCHFDCIYCTYRKIEGAGYRLFDPESVVGAVRRLASSGLKDIEFVDNVFNSPYPHAMKICEDLARARIPARLQSLELNPLLLDHDLLTIMEYAGFVGIGITVESASDQVLAGLRKGFTSRDVYRAAALVRQHDIPCLWIFMLGGPEETKETVRETLRFAETQIRPGDTAFFNLGIRIYPGTGLEFLAREQGVLSIPSDHMLEPVFYLSPQLESRWLLQEVEHSIRTYMNFISSDSIGMPLLSRLHRWAYKVGVRPPLWKYTRPLRRGLRALGVQA